MGHTSGSLRKPPTDLGRLERSQKRRKLLLGEASTLQVMLCLYKNIYDVIIESNGLYVQFYFIR